MAERIDRSHYESDEPAGSLEELEAILMNRINESFISPSAPNPAGDTQSAAIPGSQPENDVALLTHRYQGLVSRLALLEESVARMCNLLGRVEQELAALKSRAARDEK